jgi:hypothetical protein
VVQGPGWQHHPARPACLASPLRCRRHGSRARRSPEYCRGPRSRPAYDSARYSALIDGRTRKARESTLPQTIAFALPAPTSRTSALATKRSPGSPRQPHRAPARSERERSGLLRACPTAVHAYLSFIAAVALRPAAGGHDRGPFYRSFPAPHQRSTARSWAGLNR